MSLNASLDLHCGTFRLFITRRASLHLSPLVLGEVEWSALRSDNCHLAIFPPSSVIFLSLLRVRCENGEAYVLFRGSSFLEELRESLVLTLADVQNAAYWNDAVAIWFSQADGCWCVMSNRACSLPVFWSSRSDEVICSNSIQSVAASWPPPVDPVGLAEALIFDAPLRDRSIWFGIRQIPAGYSLDVSTASVTLSKRMVLQIGGNLSGDLNELADHAAKLAQRAVRLAIMPEDNVLITLSGGLDSRGIAACLPSWVRAASAVGYGHRHSLELVYSRAVARTLSIPWHGYHLDRQHFERSFLSVVDPAGVMTHRMHCHMVGAVTCIELKPVVLLPGFMGDPVQGARSGKEQRTTSAASCAVYLLEKYRQSENSVAEMFPADVRDEILHDLSWLVRDATTLHEPTQFDEYFFVIERQPKLITHIFNALSTNQIKLAFPYMDGAWARFFLSLEGRWRHQRGLFRTSLSRAAPLIADLPSVATGGVVSSWSQGQLSLMFLVHRVAQLQRIVETCSLGMLSLPDPCQTENVRHVLRTVLLSKLRRSITHLRESGLISSAVADEVESVQYKRLDAHAGFRLISLAEVLGFVSPN